MVDLLVGVGVGAGAVIDCLLLTTPRGDWQMGLPNGAAHLEEAWPMQTVLSRLWMVLLFAFVFEI